jgi:hypothetical protein
VQGATNTVSLNEGFMNDWERSPLAPRTITVSGPDDPPAVIDLADGAMAKVLELPASKG